MFDPVHADAQRDHKLTFVYFRNWAVPACTRFEENVLKDPAILQAVAELYCAVLDFHMDRQLAEDWGIAAPPGVAVVDPDRRILARLSGEVSAAELLAAIQTAKDEFAPSLQSTPVP